MKSGRQWIHFDAQFPLEFGHDITEKFGPAGQLLFVQFLCACKRSYPQGELRYRTEEEARVILGAHYEFIDADGKPWTLDAFWKWCSYRRVITTVRRNGRRIASASHWDEWEMTARSDADRERNRRSRAKTIRGRAKRVGADTRVSSAPEVGGVRGEDGGVRGEGGSRGDETSSAHAVNDSDPRERLQTVFERLKPRGDHPVIERFCTTFGKEHVEDIRRSVILLRTMNVPDGVMMEALEELIEAGRDAPIRQAMRPEPIPDQIWAAWQQICVETPADNGGRS